MHCANYNTLMGDIESRRTRAVQFSIKQDVTADMGMYFARIVNATAHSLQMNLAR